MAVVVDKLSEFVVGIGPLVFSSLLSLVSLCVPSRRSEAAGKFTSFPRPRNHISIRWITFGICGDRER